MAQVYTYNVKQSFEDWNDYYLVNKTCPNPKVYVTNSSGGSPGITPGALQGCDVEFRRPTLGIIPGESYSCQFGAAIDHTTVVDNGEDWIQLTVIESGCAAVTVTAKYSPIRAGDGSAEPTNQSFMVQNWCETSAFDLTGIVGTYYRCNDIQINYSDPPPYSWCYGDETINELLDPINWEPNLSCYTAYPIVIQSFNTTTRVVTLAEPLPFVPDIAGDYMRPTDWLKLEIFLHWPSYPLIVTCVGDDDGGGGDDPDDPGWTDCCINFEDAIEREYDLANQKIQQRLVSKTVQYSLVQKDYRARAIASRELKKSAYPLADVTLKVNRRGFKLQQGDPFILSLPEYGITRMVVRIGKIQEEGPESEIITLTCVEDVNYLGYYQGTV